MNDSDVQEEINNISNRDREVKDLTLNQIKRGAKEEFQLHRRTKDLFTVLQKSILPYIPTKSKYLYDLVVENWHTVLKLVNHTRNISAYNQNISYKYSYHSKISSAIDTLKDLTDCIYNINGFKNSSQYAYIYNEISLLGKINSGIIKLKKNTYE